MLWFKFINPLSVNPVFLNHYYLNHCRVKKFTNENLDIDSEDLINSEDSFPKYKILDL